MSSFVVYSVIMAYTTFAALYIVISQLKNPDTSFALGNNVFTNLIVSTGSTLGLYFLMSFLYLDPWHMFTSSAQYFALLPSYICTLQVYAFCNTHDVTWGTKGDNVIHIDLGVAVTTGNNNNHTPNTVELEMPSEQLDIDSGYDEALRNLRDRLEVLPPQLSEAQQQEDYYRAVRTYMVVAWMIANAILAMAVSEAYNSIHVADNFYLKFILWSVAAVAIFRALGSSAFGIINIVHWIAEGRVQMGLETLGRKVPDWVSDTASRVSGRLGLGGRFGGSGGRFGGSRGSGTGGGGSSGIGSGSGWGSSVGKL